MTDLLTLVEPLKREVAVPGTYDDVFPDTDDTALAGSLADAFAEAQLHGFFGDMTLTVETSSTTTTYTTSKDLSAAGGALIVLFAGLRVLRAQMRTLAQSTSYKAGSTEYSTSMMTTVIRDELAAMRQRIDELVLLARRGTSKVMVSDSYAGRITAYHDLRSFGGFHSYEFRG